jgi:hypothetical protein
MVPLPRALRACVQGIAITLLLSFHLYLTLSAQTTIEFYGNRVKSFRARRRGEVWSNPYDQGMKKNWQHVFGTMHPLLSVLPARRKPCAHARPHTVPHHRCAACIYIQKHMISYMYDSGRVLDRVSSLGLGDGCC